MTTLRASDIPPHHVRQFSGYYRVDEQSHCWLWIKARTRQGYGFLLRKRAQVGAHRVAYAILADTRPPGRIADDYPVCHRTIRYIKTGRLWKHVATPLVEGSL